MSTEPASRPWYCRDDVVDEYRLTLTEDGEKLPMLKALKILRAIIVNAGIILIGGYALHLGANPTVIGFTSLAVLGGYNGLELSDYLALVQAVQEVQAESSQDGGDDT
ncbi:hypothetical protein [Halobacterium salinarum]|uniref:hypothetical protein n=1 Tax=Halobacterium salinarum TaxID=2242 RepID=UPI0025552A15|nr:hypothetical protein [Halobacterium salinarum]MDL0127088.1 hypothetical protein [Halobacterium salinarum]